MKRSLIALGCLLLAGPALAQSVGEKTGVNSTLGISPTTADFVKEVAISDMFEIQSNTLAKDKRPLHRKWLLITPRPALNSRVWSQVAR
jgi:putative membrane protein